MGSDDTNARSPKSATVEERLLEAKGQLARLTAQNEKLEFTLREARDHIGKLREEVAKLTTPPMGYGVIVARHDEDDTYDVVSNGRKLRVSSHPRLTSEELEIGAEVVLNDASAIVAVKRGQRTGEIATLKEVLEDGTRVVVSLRGDDDRVFELAGSLRGRTLRPGDVVVVEPRTDLVIEQLRTDDFEHLFMEEVPDVSYDNIGGLGSQIEMIADAVELPFLHADLFSEYQLPAPKGILLYGPPGCGKTFVVRALASSGRLSVHAVKGAELMDKWVGSSEKAVRELFRRARDSAPSLVFLDEVDALAPRRGQSFDSGVTDRVVAALLTELDGIEPLRDVVVLGATNRPDLIDPALLRPGRLERLVFVEPPDADARHQILRTAAKSVPLSSDVDLGALAADLDGYSAADCVALLREAALTAMRRSIDAADVTAADVAAARETVRPSLDPVQVESLRAFAEGR